MKLKEKFRAKDQRLNNAEIIVRALDALLHSDVESPTFSLPDVKIEDTNYFICTDSAIARLLQSAHHHNSACRNQLSFRPEQTLMCGTVAVFHLSCSSGHTFSWSSSVYLPNGTFLANARWTHSLLSTLLSTGLLPNQVTRLQEAIKFFPLRDEDAEDLLSKHNTAVLTEKDYSCDQALREEIARLRWICACAQE